MYISTFDTHASVHNDRPEHILKERRDTLPTSMCTTYFKSGLGGVGNFRPCSRATTNISKDPVTESFPPRLPHPFSAHITSPTVSSISLTSSTSCTVPIPAYIGIGGAGNRSVDVIQSSRRKEEIRISQKTQVFRTSEKFDVRRSWQRWFSGESSVEKKRVSSYMMGSYFDFEDEDDAVSRTSSASSWKSRLSCSDQREVDQGLLATRPVRWQL